MGDLLRVVMVVMGGRARRSYDSFGRLVRRHDALERTTRFEWQGSVVSRIDHPSGAITTLEYDAHRALARTTLDGGSGGAISTFYRHDGRGRLIERRDARGAVRTWKYDLLDRVIEIGEPDGNRRTFTYDLAGNVVEARDRQRSVVYRYGGFHHLSAIEEAGSRVAFHYDTEERLVAVENEAGETYRYTLDATGLPIEEIGFDGETTRFDRDANGRVVRMTSPSGKNRTLEYDERGRLSKIRYDDDSWRRFRWRRDGLLAEATNADVRVRFERDARGRIVREWQDERWLASAYDPAGACVRVESSSGCVQRFGRDLLGRALGVEFDGTNVTPMRIELVRDVLGAELERRVDRKTVLRHERDLLGRPVLRSARFADRGSSELRYEWDGPRIAAIADSDDGLTSFDFDARGRLAGARSGNRDGARALDAAGNVFRRRDFLDRKYGRGGRVEKTDDAELGWDRDGNLVTRKTARGTTSYSYRADGLLGAVDLPDGTRVELRYDALGRRTKKIVSRLENGERREIRTVSWSWNASVPFEEHVSTPERDGDPVRWIFEPETFTPLARLERGRTHAVLADHLGTPREMVDTEGRLAWRMTLDPFGLPISESRPQSIDCPFRFPGQYADEETGLYYNRHRYYSPSLGGYERPDPVALEGGLRLYGYVNDPTRQIDPYGLCEPSSAASHEGTVNQPGASRTSGNVWGDGDPQSGGDGNVWGDGDPQGGGNPSSGNVWGEPEASVAKPSEPEAGGNVWGENPSSADEPSSARETGALW
jgi:RHS repeat-associated protein